MLNTVLIDGKAAAAEVHDSIARRVAGLSTPPGLATVLVGDDPASDIYVASKRRRCVEAGMVDRHRRLPRSASQSEVAEALDELAYDPAVHGILLQLPLPEHLDSADLLQRIPPEKDVDGLTERSAGRTVLGRRGLRPCTPAGVMHLLERSGVELDGAEAVVVGRSVLVGRPQAQLLLAANATVTTCHARTKELTDATRRADVLVVAAGVPHLLGADAVKPGAVVIDVGMHRLATGLCGDVDTEAVCGVAAAVTPVPGGVGPMTIAMLLQNTAQAAEWSAEA